MSRMIATETMIDAAQGQADTAKSDCGPQTNFRPEQTGSRSFLDCVDRPHSPVKRAIKLLEQFGYEARPVSFDEAVEVCLTRSEIKNGKTTETPYFKLLSVRYGLGRVRRFLHEQCAPNALYFAARMTKESSPYQLKSREGAGVSVMTIVLRLPEHMDQRKAISEALSIGSTFNGALVTAASLEDEITINELLEAEVDHDLMQRARCRALAIHQKSESDLEA